MKKSRILSFLSLVPIIFLAAGCAEQPSPKNQRKFHDEKEYNTMRQVIHDGEGQAYPSSSIGNSRVLVVPVYFADYLPDDIAKVGSNPGRGAENAREDIRKVFFGEASETHWHSLASYYYESSYGKQNFNGIVTPWFPVYNDATMKNVTAKEYSDNGGRPSNLAQEVLSYYSDELMKNYKKLTKQDGTAFKSGDEFLQYFDSNKDGNIDLVEMVYSAPIHATWFNPKTGKNEPINDDLYWAFCGGTTSAGNLNRPTLSKWAWQSYETLYESGYFDESGKHQNWTAEQIVSGEAKVDAHTIIHETGHGQGLPDYYDYDYKRSPIGSVDMMAYNVGDHNPYSKALLGWVDPIVVTGPTQVKLASFTTTGDCVMVPYRGYFNQDSKYLNTLYTEYLMICLVTPDGVNEADSRHPYQGTYPVCPTKAGIRIYHVDSRLGLFDWSSGNRKFINYTDSIVNVASNYYITTAGSNTGSERVNEAWLMKYLRSDKDSVSNAISNDNQWYEGYVFNGGSDIYANYTMNTGNKFGYRITIDECNDTGATLTFYQA